MTILRDSTGGAEDLSVVRYSDPDVRSVHDWTDFNMRVELAKFEDEDAFASRRPFEVVRFGYESLAAGLLTNIGGNFLVKLLRGDVAPQGAGGSAAAPSMSTDGTAANFRFFSNTNAKIGVGNHNDIQPPAGTAAAQTDLDLQGPTRTRFGMSTAFPKVKNETYNDATGAVVTVGDRQLVFRSVFGSADHNANWYEFTISNGGAAAGAIEATPGQTFTILDHFVSDQGRKVVGQVWEPTITFTFT